MATQKIRTPPRPEPEAACGLKHCAWSVRSCSALAVRPLKFPMFSRRPCCPRCRRSRAPYAAAKQWLSRFRQAYAIGALHQRDQLSLPAGEPRFRFGCVPGRLRVFGGTLVLRLGGGAVWLSIVSLLPRVLPAAGICGREFVALAGRNTRSNLRQLGRAQPAGFMMPTNWLGRRHTAAYNSSPGDRLWPRGHPPI
jgi:hypothetical protein